jgi:hypothetical protein
MLLFEMLLFEICLELINTRHKFQIPKGYNVLFDFGYLDFAFYMEFVFWDLVLSAGLVLMLFGIWCLEFVLLFGACYLEFVTGSFNFSPINNKF